MRHQKLLAVAMVWLGVSAAVAQQTPARPKAAPPKASTATPFDKAALEDYVRHLFVWGSQIQVTVHDPKPSEELPGFREVVVSARAGQASQEDTFYVSQDGRRIFRGTVYDLSKSPFAADAAKLKTEQDASFGPPNAPVELVVFSDFQCGYCKEEATILRKNVASTFPDTVRVTFKDFPLEPIHPWAKPASIAGRCVLRQKANLFWEYHDWIFENQGVITTENLKDKFFEWSKGKALEPIQLAACYDNKATETEVARNQAEGRALAINSTPTMFVNARRLVGGVPWQQLKAIIDHEIEYKKAHPSADKCCEVTLPTPLNK
ncbi:MAG TPA: DsbA family protein [Bryobacteraceae bacterium]|nr:DsbA family protein [Bryobacteraceae bacterium]